MNFKILRKSNILLLSLLLLFGLGSFYLYQQDQALYNQARQEINEINLDFYAQRGAVYHNNDTKSDYPLFYQELLDIDALFETAPTQCLANYLHLLKQDPGNPDIRIRLGMLFLRQKQYTAAKEQLYFIYEHKASGIQPDASWFLALVALEEKDKEKARKLLLESIEQGSNYRQKASKLLKLLG